ncbi:MAG: OmpA family protein [Bacteroidia bacterium]
MKIKITLLAFTFLLVNTLAGAQTTGGTETPKSNYGLPKKTDFDRWSAGISFGPNYFQADIQKNSKNNNSISKDLPFKAMFGAQISYQITHAMGVRIGGMFGNLAASNTMDVPNIKPEWEKNYSYESPLMEGTLEATFTLGNISFLQRNKKFHFVGSIGFGVFNFDGELTDDSTSIVVVKTGNVAEGMAVVGLGFKYQVGKRIDAGLTFDFRKTFTDKVDGINKPTTETDNYSVLRLNLNYTFGKKNQQMEWVNPMEVVYNDMAELKDKMDVLSGDKDKDGVSDMFDKDNSTAEGIKVYGDGTGVDTDGDGISDSKDGDPFSAKNARVDANGVEADADGDGVADSRDLEPNTEKGKLVNFQGITIDKTTAKTSSSVGWLPSIYFALNKTDVTGVQRDRALVVARMMKNNPDVKIKIIGNCDQSAGEDYNDKLGMRRAESVKDHLVKVYGIDAARISTESKGEKDPMAKGINSMNRRVDFSVDQAQ